MEQEMRYVYEVWRQGNFSRAAEKLYLTQSALSMAVSKAERRLGAPIFDRSHRPPLLTPAGEVYLETARQTMMLEEAMERRVADIRELNAGWLCLGGSNYLNAYILPDVLAGFHRRYPKVELRVREDSAARLAVLLSQGEIDLTFSCDEAFMTDFQRRFAFQDQILLAVPGEDPINEGLEKAALSASDVLRGEHLRENWPTVPLSVFRDLEFVLLTEGNNLHDRAVALFEEAGFSPQVKLELDQLATAYHIADHGFGATLISDRLVSAPQDRLRYYKLGSRQTQRVFYMLMPQKEYVPMAVRGFMDWFGQWYREKTATGYFQ